MLLFLLACGPKLPAVLQPDAPIDLKNCNQKQYLFARGIGSTAQKSIRSGQQQISEQIVSNLSSELEMMTEYVGETRSFNGRVEEQSDQVEKFQNYLKVSSSFDHVELIKTVVEPVEQKGQYYSLSCMKKATANKVLGDEIRPKVDQFQRLADQAQKKFSDGDIPSFSIKYHKAMDLRMEISSKLYIIRSISGRKSSLESSFNSTWSNIESSAEMVRSDVNIGLHLSDDVVFTSKKTGKKKTLEQPQLLVDAFRKGLEDSALTVRTTKQCQSGLTHFISLKVEPNCPAYHPLGQAQCFVTYHAILEDCKNKSKLELSIADKKIQAVDRYSNEKALLNVANSKHITPAMQRELRNYFPIIVLE